MNRNRIVSLVVSFAAVVGALVAAPSAIADSPWHNPTAGGGGVNLSAPAGVTPADSPWGPK
jgi:hypothetical protein